MTDSENADLPRFGMYRFISIAVLIVVILVTSLLFYRVMINFFIPLFLAALLVVLFHPLHDWYSKRFPGRGHTAATLTTATVLLIVLLPGCILLGMASVQATRIVTEINLGSIDLAIARSLKAVGLELPCATELEAVDDRLMQVNQMFDLQREHVQVEKQLAQLRNEFGTLEQALVNRDGGIHAAYFEQVSTDIDELNTYLAEAVASLDAANVEPTVEVGEATDETDPTADEMDELLPANRFHMAVASITRDYGKFKNTISGGPFLGPIRQAVNPTPEKRETWIREVFHFIQPRVVSVTQATAVFAAKALFGLMILTISIYFFLLDGPGMTKTIMALSPLDDRYEKELLIEFDKVSRAVVLATFLSALAQGVLATIGYYFAGIESIVLLFLLTSFMALIPFLGAASVWVPCCLWLAFVQDNLPAAIGLGIYGMVVVSMVDNIIKPLVLKGQSNLHPLLALLSVLGGVQVFGPIGILMGPMIVVFLQTLLEILNRELLHIDQQHPGAAASPDANATG
ncbi:AI-2E family transporter [Rosistilla oblonga]|uniref:AI-2E family transporter n=1 Tax=Rosistilla oblonga TaxID=2527990 RepID=UPI003A96F69B